MARPGPGREAPASKCKPAPRGHRRPSIIMIIGRRKMKSLKHHIVENANAARGARKHPRRDREPVAKGEPVRVIHSLGLDGATVSLPAGIDLQTRAELMNDVWRALVQFQDRDVVVVAMCASGARLATRYVRISDGRSATDLST